LPVVPTTSTTTVPGDPSLPITGGDSAAILVAGGLLAGSGVAIRRTVRRTRRTT
jgi:LPXTG-motif cell wall-anchored protein